MKKSKIKYDNEWLQIIQENKIKLNKNRQLQCGIKRKSLEYNSSAFKPLIKMKDDLNFDALENQEKKKDMSDNDCSSIKEYNQSNAGNDWASKVWIVDNSSNSSGSNKNSNVKISKNLIDNLSDQGKDNWEDKNKNMNDLRK